jgi:hypothetical protein
LSLSKVRTHTEAHTWGRVYDSLYEPQDEDLYRPSTPQRCETFTHTLTFSHTSTFNLESASKATPEPDIFSHLQPYTQPSRTITITTSTICAFQVLISTSHTTIHNPATAAHRTHDRNQLHQCSTWLLTSHNPEMVAKTMKSITYVTCSYPLPDSN